MISRYRSAASVSAWISPSLRSTGAHPGRVAHAAGGTSTVSGTSGAGRLAELGAAWHDPESHDLEAEHSGDEAGLRDLDLELCVLAKPDPAYALGEIQARLLA